MNECFLYLQQLAFVRIRGSDVAFGKFIHLPPEVCVLLPHFLHLSFNLRGGVAGFEPQPADEALFSTFRCHVGC